VNDSIIALHEVENLDRTQYSRFKYGFRPAVERFAARLAERAEAELPDLLDGPVTITAPASRAVPIGADLLADGVLRAVNHRRAQRTTPPASPAREASPCGPGKPPASPAREASPCGPGKPPAIRAKLYRFAVPVADYGTADRDGRRALLADERISGIPDLFTDRNVVVVDDLWVTGISAEVTIDTIRHWGPRSVTYLVIARVDPEQARRRPQIEYDLNHAAVTGLRTLAELCREGPVTINQRVCKFVLQHPPAEVRAWLDTVPATVAWHLHAAVLAEGFALTEPFVEAARVVIQFADRHDLDGVAASCGWSLGR
jgi:hypothetical protein